MKTILEVLKNRRTWIAIIGIATFVMSLFNHKLDIDQEVLADTITKTVGQCADLIVSGLALWSLLKPKKV